MRDASESPNFFADLPRCLIIVICNMESTSSRVCSIYNRLLTTTLRADATPLQTAPPGSCDQQFSFVNGHKALRNPSSLLRTNALSLQLTSAPRPCNGSKGQKLFLTPHELVQTRGIFIVARNGSVGKSKTLRFVSQLPTSRQKNHVLCK